jgi:hypothetical protein
VQPAAKSDRDFCIETTLLPAGATKDLASAHQYDDMSEDERELRGTHPDDKDYDYYHRRAQRSYYDPPTDSDIEEDPRERRCATLAVLAHTGLLCQRLEVSWCGSGTWLQGIAHL